MKQLQIATLAGLLCLSLSPAASAVALNGTLMIDPGFKVDGKYGGGSYFNMNAPLTVGKSITSGSIIKPGTDGGLIVGQYQSFVTDPDVPHPQGWQGDTNGDGLLEGSAGAGYTALASGGGAIITPFSFFGVSTSLGSNSVSYQSGMAALAPTAEISDCVGNICTLSLQNEALEVYWNGSVFDQGSRPDNTGPFTIATGTYDMSDNSYSILWVSQIKQGPFNSIKGYWYLEGTFVPTPVPEPASAGMMAAGLLMLGGVWRLKKQRSA